MMNSISNNINKIMKIFFFIVVPVLMILGRVLDEILFSLVNFDSYMWFILPLIAGIVMAVVLVSFFHKGFGYIAGFAITFTVLILIFSFVTERYPVGSFAAYTRERQKELDKAKDIEAPFVESLRAMYEDDTLSYRKTVDSVKIILAQDGKEAANIYIRKKVIKLKKERDFTDSTEIIIESIGKKSDFQQSETININHESLNNPETIILHEYETQASRLNFKQDDLYKVIALSGDVVTMTLAGSRQTLKVGSTYRTNINKINSGPLFFYSENGGKIVIEKQ